MSRNRSVEHDSYLAGFALHLESPRQRRAAIRPFHLSPFSFLSSLLPAGIRLQRLTRAKAGLYHRHGHTRRVRHATSGWTTRDRLWRQRHPRPSLGDEAHCPLRRRGEGCAREGPAPFWSFPRRGAGAPSPASDETESRATVASQHNRSPAGSALHPRGGNRKARFPPRAPLSRPLRSAMGRCLPSRPRPTVRDHRQRAFPPMVGNSTQAMASELCKLTAPSSLLVLPSPDRRAPARAAANHLVGPRPSGLPTAMRNITLLPSAWGEKKAVTSSSKNVSPVAPRPRANAAR